MEPPELSLTERERSTLDALLTDASVRARRRARILLDLADCKDHTSIARELRTRHAQVHRVAFSFLEKNLDSFSSAALRRVSNHSKKKPTETDLSLTAQSSMRAAARHVLDRQFSKLKHTEAAVRAAEDIEAVHDMRVACRRMNSAVRLFAEYLPKKRIKRLRPVLGELRDTLGATRDLDVLQQELETYRASAPEEDSAQLQRVAEAWRAERAMHQVELVELLDSADYQTWSKRMEALLEADNTDTSPRIAEDVPGMLWAQFGTVRGYEGRLDNATLEELHALRIEVKRLRYALEFFRDVFHLTDGTHEVPDMLIETLVALQDHLGSIQDSVVAGKALTDLIATEADRAKQAGETAPEFQAIAAYHAHLHLRIVELRDQLAERWKPLVQPEYRHHLADVTASL